MHLLVDSTFLYMLDNIIKFISLVLFLSIIFLNFVSCFNN